MTANHVLIKTLGVTRLINTVELVEIAKLIAAPPAPNIKQNINAIVFRTLIVNHVQATMDVNGIKPMTNVFHLVGLGIPTTILIFDPTVPATTTRILVVSWVELLEQSSLLRL
jgi:hypothetical protein